MAQATLTRVLHDIKSLEAEELQVVEQAIRARWLQPNGPDSSPALTDDQIDEANALLRDTIVTLPRAMGADNESIDADLARAYDDNHANLYRSHGAK